MNYRLAIAIEEGRNEERVAEHFGRCSKILVFELNESKQVIKKESYFNPLNGNHGGVCQLPGYINQYNIKTIIAGGMGAKAVANFHSFGIEVIAAPGMNCEDALNKFKEGTLSGYEECVGHSHN